MNCYTCVGILVKCRVEAHNNQEAVFVYVSHVVKRPSKRSALLYHNSQKLKV